jgi:hypothetical protein
MMGEVYPGLTAARGYSQSLFRLDLSRHCRGLPPTRRYCQLPFGFRPQNLVTPAAGVDQKKSCPREDGIVIMNLEDRFVPPCSGAAAPTDSVGSGAVP